ncbi:MAG: mechanosensitive ion channel family protein [Sphingomonadaceae bacterium]
MTRLTFRSATLAALLLLPSVASAAEEQAGDTINQIGEVIRWSGVFTSFFVIVGAIMLLRLSARFVTAFSTEFSSRRLTLHKISTVLQFLIYVLTTIIVVLLSFRLDQTALALIGGTAAVAIGFATKDLVASFIAGLIVMIDRPFQVGDRVSFGGEYGDITAIGLRSVRMQTLDDNIVTIPNNKFLSDVTASGNYGALDMQVNMDFYIASDADIDQARNIINEAALSSRFIYLDKPIVILVNQWISDHWIGVRLRLKAYVLDTRHEKAFETDVNIRVLRAFRDGGVPFPMQSAAESGR